MNGVNVGLFQFEYDLTWMAFFMDAEDRFYARYGGREDSHAESHLTQESLIHTMRQVLDLHDRKAVLENRYEPRAKPARTPEEIPPMKGMMAGRKNKCIHCHDVKVAVLRHEQSLKRFALGMIFSYPTPERVGIGLDPDLQNRVRSVGPNSPAGRAGVRRGDVILDADGHRVLTLGDFSRVLELTPTESRLPLKIRRGSKQLDLILDLAGGWRRNRDPSWRESTHVAGPGGGVWGRRLKAEERRELGLGADDLALRVTYIWGAHAKKAGIKLKDVIVELDGIRRDLTIRQLHAYLQLDKDYGDTIPVVVRRGDRKLSLTIKLPAERTD